MPFFNHSSFLRKILFCPSIWFFDASQLNFLHVNCAPFLPNVSYWNWLCLIGLHFLIINLFIFGAWNSQKHVLHGAWSLLVIHLVCSSWRRTTYVTSGPLGSPVARPSSCSDTCSHRPVELSGLRSLGLPWLWFCLLCRVQIRRRVQVRQWNTLCHCWWLHMLSTSKALQGQFSDRKGKGLKPSSMLSFPNLFIFLNSLNQL